MPSTQNLLRLKAAFQGNCRRTLKDREHQKSARGLLKGGNQSPNISFSYSFGIHNLSSTAGLRNLGRFNQSNRWFDQTVDHKKTLSMSGALSRTFSIPSVHGPSWQVCEYHTHLFLVDKSSISSSNCSPNTISELKFPRKVAVDNIIKAVTYPGTGHLDGFCTSLKSIHGAKLSSQLLGLRKDANLNKISLVASYCSIQGNDHYKRDGDRPEKRNPVGLNLAYGLFGFQFFSNGSWLRWVWGPESKGFHNFTAFLNTAARASPDITFDGSAKYDNLDDSSNASDQALLGDRVLKLLSGACYLPHPDKEATGGEDAHFICTDEQAIGVADGVGGWAQMGVNAGDYARELMSHSVAAIQEEPRGSIDLARVLEKAYSSTKARGSSTACLLALSDQGLHAVNLGDSGFLVVRDGCTILRSPVQQHDFNLTFQLESGGGSDLPSSAQVFNVQVAPGDVIIAGTDGLFDNLYNNEVTAVVVHAVRAGLGPQVTAQKIAALARQRAQDTHRQTPFSTAAQDAGFRYYGGKLDDITVVVSYVSSSNSN